MRNLLIITSFLFLISIIACQGGDKHYESYNITGPETIEEGGSVAISVGGDARASGNYSSTKKTVTTTTNTPPANNSSAQNPEWGSNPNDDSIPLTWNKDFFAPPATVNPKIIGDFTPPSAGHKNPYFGENPIYQSENPRR